MKKIVFFLLILFPSLLLRSQEINIGIIADELYLQYFDTIVNPLMNEIQRAVGNRIEIKLDRNQILPSGNNTDDAIKNYRTLCSESDVVLAFGPFSIQSILQAGDLKTPTIGLISFERDLLNLPLTIEETSGIKNFTYITGNNTLAEDALSFYDLFPYRHLSILIHSISGDQAIQNELEALKTRIRDTTGATVDVVEIGEDMKSSLENLSEKSDAVLIAAGLLSKVEINDLSAFLINRRLPSFSRSGWQVDNGVFCSKSKDRELTQLYRKTAVMIDDISRGQALEDMNVYLKSKEEWYINMATARKINVYPKFEYLFSANLINGGTETNTYTLSQIIQLAIDNNLDIQISRKDLELSEQELRYVKSNYLPSLNLQASGTQINKESAMLGTAETTLNGALNLQQVLFSQEIISGIKIQKYLNNAQKYAYESDILEIILNTYVGYFNLLSAKSYLDIQRENLNVSKRNLELAQYRLSLGSSTPADVYRWESEVANAQQSVIEAARLSMDTKLQLNTYLKNRLETDFEIADIKLNDSLYTSINRSNLSELFSNPLDLKIASDFLVNEAQKTHPAKLRLLENINAVESRHQMNKRAFYSPTLALHGQYSNMLYRGGAGSDLSDLENMGISIADNNWNVSLVLSFSIFDGTRRNIDQQKTLIQLEQMQANRDNIDQNLALGIKTRINQLVSATTNIKYSKIAADNSVKSFDMVQSNYQQGMVSVASLIDAQQAALSAKLGYDIAIYDYLISYIQLEYSIGAFSYFLTPGQKADFKSRFMQYYLDNQ